MPGRNNLAQEAAASAYTHNKPPERPSLTATSSRTQHRDADFDYEIPFRTTTLIQWLRAAENAKAKAKAKAPRRMQTPRAAAAATQQAAAAAPPTAATATASPTTPPRAQPKRKVPPAATPTAATRPSTVPRVTGRSKNPWVGAPPPQGTSNEPTAEMRNVMHATVINAANGMGYEQLSVLHDLAKRLQQQQQQPERGRG